MINKKSKTFKIAIAATLASLAFVLDLLSMKADFAKYTIYGLPLLISGILFGPSVGLLCGFVAGFLSQVFGGYGLTPTTPLWLLAPMAWGFISGLINKLFKSKYHPIKVGVTVVITSLTATLFNTLALILDGIINNYSYAYVYANLGIRILTSIAMSIIYTFVLILILPRLKKVTNS